MQDVTSMNSMTAGRLPNVEIGKTTLSTVFCEEQWTREFSEIYLRKTCLFRTNFMACAIARRSHLVGTHLVGGMYGSIIAVLAGKWDVLDDKKLRL